MAYRFSFLNNSSEEPLWVSPWNKGSPQCFTVRNQKKKVISRYFLPLGFSNKTGEIKEINRGAVRTCLVAELLIESHERAAPVPPSPRPHSTPLGASPALTARRAGRGPRSPGVQRCGSRPLSARLCLRQAERRCGPLPAPMPHRWRRAASTPTASAGPAVPTCPRPHRPPAPPLALCAANGVAAVSLGPPAAGRGRAVGRGGREESGGEGS